MSSYLLKLVFLMGLMLPGWVLAQDNEVKAAVVISVQQNQDFWAGQQITLNLDLKTTGFSFSNSHFNLPEVSGAFLMQTDTTTIKLSEFVDGQDWQIIRYPLALYPQKSGRLDVPAIDVRFNTSAGFGSPEKAFEFQTNPLELTIKLPPGVKQGDLVVTTTSFQLDHVWQPTSGAAYTGDAFTLTVTRRANDISAMLLPPLPVFRTEGLAAYPQAPGVEDKTNRGDLTGERIDSIIWVVEKPGIYEIPGIRFQWWDPGSFELKQQIVPGINLDIPTSPAAENVTVPDEKPQQNSRKLLALLIFALAGLFSSVLWLHFRRKRTDSGPINEKSAFARLQRTCIGNQAVETHSAIYTWLACCPIQSEAEPRPSTLGEFARIFNDKQLATELEQLQKAVVGSIDHWQGNNLLNLLKNIRDKINKQKTAQSKAHLAPLNP